MCSKRDCSARKRHDVAKVRKEVSGRAMNVVMWWRNDGSNGWAEMSENTRSPETRS